VPSPHAASADAWYILDRALKSAVSGERVCERV